MGVFNLEKHFAFYGAYHRNPINVAIHMLFVWPIAFSFLILLYNTNPIFDFTPILGFLVLNTGFVLTLVYAIFYVVLEPKSGSLAALVCFACWVGASFTALKLGSSLAWKVGVASQLICWTGQFIGHGVFEKRAPALLDNLLQAFVMAPFFVLLEGLQTFLDYEPYPGFRSSVNAKIESEVKVWEDKKSKKVS